MTAVLCCALIAVGCGDDGPQSAGADGKGLTKGTQAASDDAERSIPVETRSEAVARPKPQVPSGPTTGELVVRDLVRGAGNVAQEGDLLYVRFVAGIYETGEEIEFAGGAGRPIGFLLGSGDWSSGWEAGMPGMRVGGRRELIFSTTSAFTPPGSELGDTMVYVVDLLRITEPGG